MALKNGIESHVKRGGKDDDREGVYGYKQIVGKAVDFHRAGL
jgi:hypothetical protein